MSDNVNHPSHYAEGREFEPKDVIRDWGLNFNLGNVVKYLSRAGRKDDIVQDLKKAQLYIQFEIEALEVERSKKCAEPKCKCDIRPEYIEMEGGNGVITGDITLELSKGASLEEIIEAVTAQIVGVYGGESYAD